MSPEPSSSPTCCRPCAPAPRPALARGGGFAVSTKNIWLRVAVLGRNDHSPVLKRPQQELASSHQGFPVLLLPAETCEALEHGIAALCEDPGRVRRGRDEAALAVVVSPKCPLSTAAFSSRESCGSGVTLGALRPAREPAMPRPVERVFPAP